MPASPEEWARFLRPLLAAVSNPPSAEDFRKRIAAITAAMRDVEPAMLTDWRQQDAMRRFKFWPSVADISEWLAPDLAAERESRDREQRLALVAPKPIAEIIERLTPEQIAANKAKVAALKADIATSPTARPAAQPCWLKPGDLAALRAKNPLVQAALAMQAKRREVAQ